MNNSIKGYLTNNINPINIIKTLIFKYKFMRDNPTYFDPAGIWVFSGCQGSGKTLSAVDCLNEIRKFYPHAIVVSNIDLQGVDYIEFTDYTQIYDITNGIEGVVFLLDEIQTLWNSLESKDIPISEIATFCQNRKDRRVIIGCSQVYGRIAKPIREQLQYVVQCRCLFGLIQWNTIVDPTQDEEKDGKLVGNIIGHQLYFHKPDMYKRYNTLQKVTRIERKEIIKNVRNYKRNVS